MPTRGQCGFLCTPGGDLYVAGGAGRLRIGGRRQFTLLGDVWRWRDGGRFEDLTARTGMPMPPTIEAHLAADADGRVYEFGGIQDSLDGTFSQQLYRFTPGDERWETITPTASPDGREDHGFVGDTRRNLLWLFGGVTADARQLNDLWVYDVRRGEWRTVPLSTVDVPHPRELYDLAWDGADALYLFGGYADDLGYLHDFWRFDIPQSRWVDLTAASGAERISPRSYNGLAVDGQGIVWMAGGFDNPAVLGELWRYDPQIGTWREVPVDADGLLPRVTYEMQYRPQDGSLYLFGGLLADVTSPSGYATSAELWRGDLHPRIVAASPVRDDTLRVHGDTTLVFVPRIETESGRPARLAWTIDGLAIGGGLDTLRWRPRWSGLHRIAVQAWDGPLADSAAWWVEARDVPVPPPRLAVRVSAIAGSAPGLYRVDLRRTRRVPVAVRVVDAAGRTVWRGAAAADARSLDIDLRAFRKSIYFLHAQADTLVRRARLPHVD